MPKLKNILIFTGIAAVFVLIYIFYIKESSPQENLVSSPSLGLPASTNSSEFGAGALSETPVVAKDFLALLLNVKNIKLDDSIFSDPSFNNLHDSSITLIPDGNEGRPNPFAQFGNDEMSAPISNSGSVAAPTGAPATP